jgi:hypothetical protein
MANQTGVAGAAGGSEIDSKPINPDALSEGRSSFEYRIVRVDSILGPLWVTDRSAKQITVIDQWARVGRAMEGDHK